MNAPITQKHQKVFFLTKSAFGPKVLDQKFWTKSFGDFRSTRQHENQCLTSYGVNLANWCVSFNYLVRYKKNQKGLNKY